MELCDIWEIEDEFDFINALDDYLWEKCEHGQNMNALSPSERIFYLNQLVEAEVNNGGFYQFFFNTFDDFNNEIASCFRAIGANRTAEICLEACAALGGNSSDDFDKVFEDEVQNALRTCDKAFYGYPDNLKALNYRFVMEHRADFT